MTIFEGAILFILIVLAISHTGIAWAGCLITPGNLLDWLPSRINKIKNTYIQDLLKCPKCISGQCALWVFIAVSFHVEQFHWFFSPAIGLIFISVVIVVTDQLFRRYGYG